MHMLHNDLLVVALVNISKADYWVKLIIGSEILFVLEIDDQQLGDLEKDPQYILIIGYA